MHTEDDYNLQKQIIAGIEREARELRQGLRDQFFKSALAGLLVSGYDGTDKATVRLAWHIASEAVRQRKEAVE